MGDQPAWMNKAAIALSLAEMEAKQKEEERLKALQEKSELHALNCRKYLALFLEVDPLEVPQGSFLDHQALPLSSGSIGGLEAPWTCRLHGFRWRIGVKVASTFMNNWSDKNLRPQQFGGIEMAHGREGMYSWYGVSNHTSLGRALTRLGKITA